MTDDLYSRDSYLRTCDATVVDVREEGVVLDRTVFYPRGGGQPGDSGVLHHPDGDCRITDTTKSRDDGETLHVVDPATAPPPIGASVVAEIDWDRRYQHMRTHTALHALSGVVFGDFHAKVTGGNMDSGGAARMDFELDAISQEFGREVEERLNQRLAADVPVHVRFVPRAEALADPDLIRTKVSLIPDVVDPIRVIDITGIDKQADGGTHVASSGEVGRVRVVKTESKGKANKRIRIQLEEP
ncbi:MAG: alanyl-tRNA editing protein [Actinomycetota bacterium]|nr:alanyl-tRNA editing protein [Actinomycetota bacterium]MDH5314410.1 alanyl-tRNA editing protein [Actinomycetota bacterium]